jgi:hypothetical protein
MTSISKSIASTLLLASFVLMPAGASAITVEVAKTCNALITKQFPPRQVGNPAAGSAKGTGQAERDFFKKCVANGGKMDAADQGSSKP